MTVPIFLSPALPSELLTYVLNYHAYPTTLIICSSRTEFLNSLVQEVRASEGTGQEDSSRENDPHALLLSSPLHQVATSRHIRLVYVPTVTHLRAYLSVFSPNDSRVAAPPTDSSAAVTRHGEAHVILYGLLALHRDTSEWSAQGLGNTTSAIVDLATRLSWPALAIEPRVRCHPSTPSDGVLREPVPILSGGARRLGLDSEEGAWTGRTVEVGRVLGRWFRFERGQWDTGNIHA
ncbi:hypothetical protein GGS20DRAFT_590230 [Poronia punctata]|nr:hypothetical protein GGS20DRAFT_590230 [Poronia punctata]